MNRAKDIFKTVLYCILALLIPCLLAVAGIQAHRYTDLENEVKGLEKKQTELIEENKKLIKEISILSSADRIEDIAQNELGMREAKSEEIVRVEMKENKQ